MSSTQEDRVLITLWGGKSVAVVPLDMYRQLTAVNVESSRYRHALMTKTDRCVELRTIRDQQAEELAAKDARIAELERKGEDARRAYELLQQCRAERATADKSADEWQPYTYGQPLAEGDYWLRFEDGTVSVVPLLWYCDVDHGEWHHVNTSGEWIDDLEDLETIVAVMPVRRPTADAPTAEPAPDPRPVPPWCSLTREDQPAGEPPFTVEPPTFTALIRAHAERAGYEFYDFREEPASWFVWGRRQKILALDPVRGLEGSADSAWLPLTEERALRIAAAWPDKDVDHVARARQVVESAQSSWFSCSKDEAMRDLIRAVDALVCALEEKSVHTRERSR